MYYYLNEDKTCRPCTKEEWLEQRKEMISSKSKHVGKDIIDDCLISTVWVGLDMNNGALLNDKTPHLFETMVFSENHGGSELFMRRYSTWKDAERGHKIVCYLISSACSNINDEYNKLECNAE